MLADSDHKNILAVQDGSTETPTLFTTSLKARLVGKALLINGKLNPFIMYVCGGSTVNQCRTLMPFGVFFSLLLLCYVCLTKTSMLALPLVHFQQQM